jgi:hypothetical protein
LITTDIDSKTKVNSFWPDIKIVVISVDKSMHGAQKYSHALILQKRLLLVEWGKDTKIRHLLSVLDLRLH